MIALQRTQVIAVTVRQARVAVGTDAEPIGSVALCQHTIATHCRGKEKALERHDATVVAPNRGT